MAKRQHPDRSALLRLRSLNLESLKVFDVVYRELNYTRAAAKMPGGADQPYLTKRIKALEKIFGGKLFTRAGAGVTATPLAKRLAEPIRKQVDHCETILAHAVTFDSAKSEQSFVLHIRPDAAPFMAPRLVKRIAESAPNIGLYMKARRDKLLASDLRAGDPQLAVFTELVEDGSCLHDALFEDRLVVISRKDHPRIKGKMTRELYGELEHIIAARMGPHDLGPFDLHCRKNGINRRVRLATPIPTVVPDILAQTDFIATTSRRMANYFRRYYNIAIHDLPMRDLTLTYYMMWHKHFSEDAGHVWLRKQIKEVAREVALDDGS